MVALSYRDGTPVFVKDLWGFTQRSVTGVKRRVVRRPFSSREHARDEEPIDHVREWQRGKVSK